MKPYYETELGKLYHGDSREIVGQLKGETVITDPVWPNCTPELKGSDDPFGLLHRCLSSLNPTVNRLAIHLGGTSDPRFLKSVPDKRFEFFRCVYMRIIKPAYVGRILMTNDMAYLFGPPPKSKPGQHLIPGYVEDNSSNGKQANHPCPRKIKHVMWLVQWWSQDYDIVIDPFMGSGTTAVACERLNRNWLGIEIEEKFCEESARRLEAERKQLKLF